jgi:hypothetical protein
MRGGGVREPIEILRFEALWVAHRKRAKNMPHGAARDVAAVCKLARECLHRRRPSRVGTRIRRQKQKGDAVQSVAGSVDTVNRK